MLRPERVTEGKRHWFVWLLEPLGQERIYRLRMVRK